MSLTANLISMAGVSTQPSFPLTSRVAALLAALLMSLGPLGLLQAVAWTGMALDYGSRYGVAAGLERTFDGKHPCPLCKEIAKARQSDKESKSAVTITPVNFSCVVACGTKEPFAFPPRQEITYFVGPNFFAVRTERPPLPPPRSLAA